LKTLGLGSLGALVFLSLSRGAVLACAVFVVLSLAFLAARRPVVAGAILAVFIGAGLYIGAAYGDALSAAWGTRVDQTTASLSEGETNDLTSGRLTLAASAVADLADSPIFGVGFTGFHEGRSAFTETDALNSSPHNQYLTMLWKPGVLAGGALLAFLYQCMVHLDRLRRAERDKETYVGLWCMAIGVLGVASFTWDVLLVPNIGAIMLFLFGACAAIVTHQAPPEVG
jgi:O-antigen ligase